MKTFIASGQHRTTFYNPSRDNCQNKFFEIKAALFRSGLCAKRRLREKAGGLWQVESGEHIMALRQMGSHGPVLWLHHCGVGGVSAESERVPGHLSLEKRRNSEVGVQRISLS